MKKIFCMLCYGVMLLAGMNAAAFDKNCNEVSAWLAFPEKKATPLIQEVDCGGKKLFRLKSHEGSTIAEMPFPEIPQGFEINRGDCRLDGKLRYDIIAVVKHRNDTEISKNIHKAWIADPVSCSFRPVDEKKEIKKLECINIGYGL